MTRITTGNAPSCGTYVVEESFEDITKWLRRGVAFIKVTSTARGNKPLTINAAHIEAVEPYGD